MLSSRLTIHILKYSHPLPVNSKACLAVVDASAYPSPIVSSKRLSLLPEQRPRTITAKTRENHMPFGLYLGLYLQQRKGQPKLPSMAHRCETLIIPIWEVRDLDGVFIEHAFVSLCVTSIAVAQ